MIEFDATKDDVHQAYLAGFNAAKEMAASRLQRGREEWSLRCEFARQYTSSDVTAIATLDKAIALVRALTPPERSPET